VTTGDVLPRVAAGDQAAVRECLSRYGGLVWSLARRLLGPSDAEDAVQEVFVDLWKSAGRFDAGRGSELTFVGALARRRLIDRRRAAGRRPELAPLPDSLPAADDDTVERRDEADRAWQAVGELGDAERRVLTLAIRGGLTHDEIARATGLPLGTVKTHARRGLQRVRELLSRPAPVPGGAP
jgi:RNA polymerase sigma-70 factor (ECF subfamily)